MTQLTALANQQQRSTNGDGSSDGAIQQLPPAGVTALATRGAFTTAVQVAQERELTKVLRRLEAEADLAGEEFYYGWGAGKNHIEGPSVKLAMAAVRCYGNSAVEILPMQETHDAWVFTAAFVDFETGFTLTRQFRQSKASMVYGNHDEERKADIRFQIGQSKAARNVVINALPASLITRALAKAKDGVFMNMAASIEKHGPVAVIEKMLGKFEKLGITEQQILCKCNVADRKGLTTENLVTLKGDLWAIENGQDWADEIFPDPDKLMEGADDTAPKDPKSQRLLKDLKNGKSGFDGEGKGKPTSEETAPPPSADELAASTAGG